MKTPQVPKLKPLQTLDLLKKHGTAFTRNPVEMREQIDKVEHEYGRAVRQLSGQVTPEVYKILEDSLEAAMKPLRERHIFDILDARDATEVAKEVTRRIPGARYWEKGGFRRIYLSQGGKQEYVSIDGHINRPGNRRGPSLAPVQVERVRQQYRQSLRERALAKLPPEMRSFVILGEPPG